MGRRKTDEITPKQVETLRAFETFLDENGYPPTVQEMATILEISHASVHERINQLIRKGFLSREDGKARSISVEKSIAPVSMELVSLPILGKVAAGMPVFAEENILGEILVDSAKIRGGECFVLYADGESMIDAGIQSGDALVVKCQQLAQDGDIVVALLNGDATVKRLKWTSNTIALIPENRKMEPIPVNPEDDLRIVGKVVSWQSRSL